MLMGRETTAVCEQSLAGSTSGRCVCDVEDFSLGVTSLPNSLVQVFFLSVLTGIFFNVVCSQQIMSFYF